MSQMVFAHRSRPTPRAAAIDRRSVLRALLTTGVAASLPACDGVSVSTTDPRLLPAALAERYVRLTQALALHQPSLVEAWLGPAPTSPAGPRRPVAALRAETTALLADVSMTKAATDAASNSTVGRKAGAASQETTRLRYLEGQVRALDAAAARLLGESSTFAVQAARTFGYAAPSRDAAALDRLRADLAALLPGAGTLAERHAAFRRAAAVPADRVDAVFAAAVDWCRRAAAGHLPLPAGETLTTRAEDTTGWAAFSRPTGPRASELWVARRGGADAAHLLQLAAHEGTPGHHAQHVLASAALVEGRGWPERALHPGFGPHRLVAEGAAEAGAALLLPEDVRIRVLADAFEIVRRKHAGAELLVVGDGPEAAVLSGRAGITHIPFQTNLAGVWSRIDVAVTPSVEPDPFPRAVIEAMSYGKPVVAAATGGIPEAIAHEETGLLVEPASVEDLAAALTRFLDAPELVARMGTAGRRRCEQRYSVQTQQTALDRIYQTVIGGSSPGRLIRH